LGNGVRIDRAVFGKRIVIPSLGHRNGQNAFRFRSDSLGAPRYRPDTVGLPVDLSNDVVLRVGDEEVSLCIEGETLRLI
jgi:hypothetical protein